jgi:hypothetical protein
VCVCLRVKLVKWIMKIMPTDCFCFVRVRCCWEQKLKNKMLTNNFFFLNSFVLYPWMNMWNLSLCLEHTHAYTLTKWLVYCKHTTRRNILTVFLLFFICSYVASSNVKHDYPLFLLKHKREFYVLHVVVWQETPWSVLFENSVVVN